MCVKEIGLSQSHSSGDPPSAVARLQPCNKIDTFNHKYLAKLTKYFHKFYNININV